MKTEHIKMEKLFIIIVIIGAVLIIASILGVCFFVGNNIKKNKKEELSMNPNDINDYYFKYGYLKSKNDTNQIMIGFRPAKNIQGGKPF